MRFDLRFIGPDGGAEAEGQIFLPPVEEGFVADLSHYSRAQYQCQWRAALRRALEERRIAALFQSVEIGADGVGQLRLYPVIPAECAGAGASAEQGGIYLCERVMWVTLRPEAFVRRPRLAYEGGTEGADLALYFLDLAAPERFYGYLDSRICGLSHWYFSDAAVAAFLAASGDVAATGEDRRKC